MFNKKLLATQRKSLSNEQHNEILKSEGLTPRHWRIL